MAETAQHERPSSPSEESKSDSDSSAGELHRACRICYSEEFQDGMGAFLRPTPCNCAGNRSAVHETCLRRWQTIARRNRQWAAGAGTCEISTVPDCTPANTSSRPNDKRVA